MKKKRRIEKFLRYLVKLLNALIEFLEDENQESPPDSTG